MFIRENLKK